MPNPANRFNKHATKALVALWALSLLAGLLLLEWVLAPGGKRHRASALSAGPASARYLVMREWKRNTDYQFTPPAERKKYLDHGPAAEGYALATDAEGFVEPARRHQQPDVSIVFFGGSTTECAFVQPENRFPYLAARKLEDALGVKVNGLNAGLSGNNSMHALLLLLGKAIPLRPDFAVLMEGINDIGALSTYHSYWIKQGSLRLLEEEKVSVGESARTLVKALLPYTSEFLQQARRSLRPLLRASPAHAESSIKAEPKFEIEPRAMARAYESSLRSFARVAAAWGITPVFMTQVNVKPVSDAQRGETFLNRERLAGIVERVEDFADSHDHFNAILRKVAQSEGAILIDLARARDWAFGDVYDAVHFTDHGSQIVAEIIAAALKDHVMARAKTASSGR